MTLGIESHRGELAVTRRRGLLRVVLACALTAAVAVTAAASARPRRWSEPVAGWTRDEVHALLGTPDADFSPKGWDGWDQPVLVGAWVLRVYYSESGIVLSTRTSFDAGLDHLWWDRTPARDARERARPIAAERGPASGGE